MVLLLYASHDFEIISEAGVHKEVREHIRWMFLAPTNRNTARHDLNTVLVGEILFLGLYRTNYLRSTTEKPNTRKHCILILRKWTTQNLFTDFCFLPMATPWMEVTRTIFGF